MRAGGVTTPEIRRRVPSCQREDDGREHEHDTSIRVVQTTPLSAPMSSQAASQGRSYRKAVPTACEEDGVDGASAGSMYLEQAALSYRRHTHAHQTSNIAESVSSASGNGLPDHGGKAMRPDQRSEGSDDKSCSLDSPFSPNPSGASYTVSQHEGSLLSSSSASSTLAGIGRSLQWSQKFPQGRHLSRATSIATKGYDGYANESSSIGSKLSEARAGLRLLAKRREEVAEDEESKTRERRWGKHKWILFVSVLVVFTYGTLGLTYSLMTWAGAWDGARLSVIVDPDIVILLSVASSLCLLTSIVGLSGTILNSRPILALYSFLLWPSLLSMLSVGYTGYKRNNLRLDLKLNQTWSRYLNDLARLQVQELLSCCGYYSPLHQATFSRHCYPRTTLPGCKGSLYRFERRTLLHLYSATFSVIFVHLAAIVVSLLCSNHVNVTFGKGLTPRAYRLDMGHVRRNAINIIRILSASTSELVDVQHILHVDNEAGTHSETKDARREWDDVRRDGNQSD